MSKPPKLLRAAVLIQVVSLLVCAYAKENAGDPDWLEPVPLQVPGPDYVGHPDFSESEFPWLPLGLAGLGLTITACLCALGYRNGRSRTTEARAILNRAQQVAALESGTSARQTSLPGSRVNSSDQRREYGTERSSQVGRSDVAINFRPSAPPSAQLIATPSRNGDKLISFKMHSDKAAEPCGICLEPFGIADVTAGQCLHVFHTACLKTWLAKERSHELCPLCRNLFQGAAQDIDEFMELLKRVELEKPARKLVQAVDS